MAVHAYTAFELRPEPAEFLCSVSSVLFVSVESACKVTRLALDSLPRAHDVNDVLLYLGTGNKPPIETAFSKWHLSRKPFQSQTLAQRVCMKHVFTTVQPNVSYLPLPTRTSAYIHTSTLISPNPWLVPVATPYLVYAARALTVTGLAFPASPATALPPVLQRLLSRNL